jgi:hypothetical protein
LKENIARKIKQIDFKRNINWLIRKQSHLSIENKLLIYKAVIKFISSYEIELWGCGSQSKIHHAEIPKLNTQSHTKCTPVCDKPHSTYRLQPTLLSDVIHERINKHHNNPEAHPNPLL